MHLTLKLFDHELVFSMILISGEVARTTDFEQRFSIHFTPRHDSWQSNPLIMDDRRAIVNVRDKGPVIIDSILP